MAFSYVKPSITSRFSDAFILMGIRHIVKKIIFKGDVSLTYSKKDTLATTIRCTNCLKLCRYTFNNVLYHCNSCKQRTT